MDKFADIVKKDMREKKEKRQLLADKFLRIKDGVKRMMGEKYPHIKIFLVGSAARGDFKSNSDIDFLMEGGCVDYFKVFGDLEDICYKYDVEFDLINFEDVNNGIFRQLLEEEKIQL